MSYIQIIETVTFRTRKGVSDDQFQAAIEGLESYFSTCDGYRGRVVYKTAEGLWMDQLSWADEAAVAAADAGFRSHPAAAAYMSFVERDSVTMHKTPALFAKVA